MRRSRVESGRSRGNAGFTLLELLVATVIFVVLLGILMQAFAQTSQLWLIAKRQSEHSLNCRAIGDFIGDELKKALLPLDKTSTNALQFVVNPPSLSPAYLNRDAIFWQAPIALEQNGGDIAEIGYFVKWDESRPENPRGFLCRFFASPTRNGVANANFRIYSHPDDWINDTVVQAVAPAIAANDYEGLFAENIVGFWVKCLDSGGMPLSSSFDSRQGGYVDSKDGILRHLPRWVEISFLTLDSTSAARVTPSAMNAIIGLVSAADSATKCVNTALNNSALVGIAPGMRVYSTKIYLENSR